jgi:hypothetical protein
VRLRPEGGGRAFQGGGVVFFAIPRLFRNVLTMCMSLHALGRSWGIFKSAAKLPLAYG